MIRVLSCGAVIVGLVGVLGATGPQLQQPQQPSQSPQQQQSPPQPPQPTFRGSTDIVRVFVTVMDRDGRLVTTLNRDDFEVRDNGKPQPITAFDNTPRPIRLIVMLDCSGSMSGNLPLLRASAEQLFTRLRPDDAARVGTFGNDVTISPTFTRDPGALRAALPEFIEPDAPTPLWRGVDEAMTVLKGRGKQDTDGKEDPEKAAAEAAELRPVVLVLSDGKDSGPIGFNKHYVSQVDVIDRARNESVMIYGIGMRSRSARPAPPGIGPGGLMASLTADMPDPGLARVAEDSGGGYAEVKPSQDLGAAFARVAEELHSQYLLGYAPPSRDGKVHKIDVRLTKGGLQARARKTYVAAKS